MDELVNELQDKHRQQVREIHQRHQDDLELHLQKFSDDACKKDDDYRQQIQNYEERSAAVVLLFVTSLGGLQMCRKAHGLGIEI